MKRKTLILFFIGLVLLLLAIYGNNITLYFLNKTDSKPNETHFNSNKADKLKIKDLDDCYFMEDKKFCKIGEMEVLPGTTNEEDYEIKYKT